MSILASSPCMPEQLAVETGEEAHHTHLQRLQVPLAEGSLFQLVGQLHYTCKREEGNEQDKGSKHATITNNLVRATIVVACAIDEVSLSNSSIHSPKTTSSLLAMGTHRMLLVSKSSCARHTRRRVITVSHYLSFINWARV